MGNNKQFNYQFFFRIKKLKNNGPRSEESDPEEDVRLWANYKHCAYFSAL